MIWRLNCHLLLHIHGITAGKSLQQSQMGFGLQPLLLVGGGANCVGKSWKSSLWTGSWQELCQVWAPGGSASPSVTPHEPPENPLDTPGAGRAPCGVWGRAALLLCVRINDTWERNLRKNGFWLFFLQFPAPEAVTVDCAFSCPQKKASQCRWEIEKSPTWPWPGHLSL